MRDLAAREHPDFDSHGYPVRRGEVLSLGLSTREIRRAQKLGYIVIEDVPLAALGLRMVRLRAPADLDTATAVSNLRQGSSDNIYEFDHYYGVSGDARPGAAVPSPAAKSRAGAPLIIGMIDTAVAANFSLNSVALEAHDFTGTASQAGTAPVAHGTAVASILARNGATRLVSANIFSADARPFASADAIARAVNWMVARGVPVINISIAGPSNQLVDRVIATATARGHIVVAAAGNGGPAAMPAYPAASPGAVAVTAVDGSGGVYMHANHGDYITIAALGVGVVAAAPDGRWHQFSGTSFAAPLVAAELAGCVSRTKGHDGKACVARMERGARDLGAPGRDPVYGFGLLVR